MFRRNAVLGSAVLLLLALLGSQVTSRKDVLPVQAATTPIASSLEPTDRPAERYQGSFYDLSSGAMLDRLGVRVYAEDRVFAFPDPSLGLGSELRVYRAQPVLVRDGKKERLVRTWATTVQGIADEQGIELGEKDIVVPARESVITLQEQPISLTITRVAESEVTLSSAIEYKTEYVDDGTMLRGETKVDQKGSKGVLKKYYLVRREDGVEVSRKELKREVAKEAVTEVIRRGTKVVNLDEGLATFYGLSGRQCGAQRFTAAHKTLPKGTRVRVVNKANGKSVIVTIDDRGPYGAGRVIDLSCDAFASIASLSTGIIQVRVEKE